MGSRSPLTFSPDDARVLSDERYSHPDPRVQRQMEVLWLIGQGEGQTRAGQLRGVSKATVERYVAIYRSQGPDFDRALGPLPCGKVWFACEYKRTG